MLTFVILIASAILDFFLIYVLIAQEMRHQKSIDKFRTENLNQRLRIRALEDEILKR